MNSDALNKKGRERYFHALRKIAVIMRLTAFILFSAYLQVSATAYAQKVTLNENNVSLKKVFNDIKRQTGYSFIYAKEDISKASPVTINVKDANLKDVLNKCFAEQPLTFLIENDIIIVKPKPSSPVVQALPDKEIKGTVTDSATNKPLTGVTIKVKGETIGTVTDANGQFILEVPEGAVLEVSYLGYTTKTVLTDGKSSFNISLSSTATGLNQLVVVAYGTQKQANVTGAVTTVAPEELTRSSEPDLNNQLTGRAPGVRVEQYSSQPGIYASQIDIRGFSTESNSGNAPGTETSLPLIVIDGVPRDLSTFQMLDPNDIASLTILKDATSSIYGVEAANGVILVTTKKGSVQPVTVNYTFQGGGQFITRYPKLSNAYQYATLYDEQQFNNALSSNSQPPVPMFSQQQIAEYKSGQLPSYDWLRAVMNTHSSQQQQNLNISGGTEKIRFFLSGGYFNQGGLLTSHMEVGKKYNLRGDVTAEIAKGMTIDANLGLINNISNQPSTATWALLKDDWRFAPVYPFYANNNPKYLNQVPNDQNPNPLGLINQDLAGYNNMNTNDFMSTFTLKYKVPYIEGLTANALFAYDKNNTHNKHFTKVYTEYTYDSATNAYTGVGGFNGGVSNMNESFNESIRNDLQFSLNYDKLFGNHHITLLGLYEQIYNQGNGINGSGNYVIDALDQLFAINPATALVSSNYGSSSSRSYAGRVNYDYAGKYLLEAGFRYEGSSYFPANSRWGFFPYVSGGWRISEEPFIKDHLKFIDNLKIRGSYGKEGDDAAAAASFPAFLTGYTYPGGNSVFGAGGSYAGSVFGSSGTFTKDLGFKNSVNPNITWYTSLMSDIGLDFSLWNGKLTFTGDVFRRDRSGLLATPVIAIPGTYGLSLPPQNINSDRTEGFEITLGTSGKIGQLSYSISPNISFARTMWLHYEQSAPLNSLSNWHGQLSHQWNDILWGYKVTGQFQNYQQIYAAPIQDGAGNRTLLPGDLEFKDVNHDGQITSADMVPIATGNAIPLIYFATNIGLNWKGLSLYVLVQGATMYYQNYQDQTSRPFTFIDSNPPAFYFNRWHQANMFDPNSPWIPGKYPSTGQRQQYNYYPNTFFTYNATYVRLKSVELSYTFRKVSFWDVKFKAIRVFANGYDLLTFTGKGLDFVDPEYSAAQLYSYNYPIMMTVNLGAQITF